MNLDELASTSGEWLRGSGPESDIVVSSRIRLARNLADFPFVSRASESDRAEIERILHGRTDSLLQKDQTFGSLCYVDVRVLPEVDRQFLVERQLISREHAESDGARSVVLIKLSDSV